MGARLQEEAQRWEWDRVGAQRDAWLGEQVASLAEVIFKCANALHAADLPAAALQRDVFVPRWLLAASVQARLLYDSEKHLPRLVAAAMGPHWSEVQHGALIVDSQSVQDSIAAAFELYAFLARPLLPALDEGRAAVVEAALRLVEGA